MSDLETQSLEVEVLKSIYTSEEELSTYKNSDGLICVQFYAFLDLPDKFSVMFLDDSKSEEDVCRSESIESNLLIVHHLPPIELIADLPIDYPSKSAPKYNLSCSWLPADLLLKLCQRLDEIWKENEMSEILFMWTNFLKAETLGFLDLENCLQMKLSCFKPHKSQIKKRDDLKKTSGSVTDFNDDNENASELADLKSNSNVNNSTSTSQTICNESMSGEKKRGSGKEKYSRELNFVCNKGESCGFELNKRASKTVNYQVATSSQSNLEDSKSGDHSDSNNKHRKKVFHSRSFYNRKLLTAGASSNIKQHTAKYIDDNFSRHPSYHVKHSNGQSSPSYGSTSGAKFTDLRNASHDRYNNAAVRNRPHSNNRRGRNNYRNNFSKNRNNYTDNYSGRACGKLSNERLNSPNKCDSSVILSGTSQVVQSTQCGDDRQLKKLNFVTTDCDRVNMSDQVDEGMLVSGSEPVCKDKSDQQRTISASDSLNVVADQIAGLEISNDSCSTEGISIPKNIEDETDKCLSLCCDEDNIVTNKDSRIGKCASHYYFDYFKKYLQEYNEDRILCEFRKAYYDCSICYEVKKGLDCMEFKPCYHVFCKDCVGTFIRGKINDGAVYVMKCPEIKCGSDITPSQVLEAVGPDLFAKYDNLLLNTTLQTMTDITICPRSACQYPVMRDPEEKMATCPSCRYVFCVFCRMVYHGVEACRFRNDEKAALVKKYNEGSDQEKQAMEQRYGKKQLVSLVQASLSENWIVNNSQNCPHCNASIEKNGGCNKMVCWRCSTYFCWICQVQLDPYQPYVHYNDRKSRCYNQLFQGVDISDDDDDDNNDGDFLMVEHFVDYQLDE